MKPTLVVLAAGMGSRYGGLKQVDPVGPSGEAILDYSVFDAIRGGFLSMTVCLRFSSTTRMIVLLAPSGGVYREGEF